jgi:hypothetical protein
MPSPRIGVSTSELDGLKLKLSALEAAREKSEQLSDESRAIALEALNKQISITRVAILSLSIPTTPVADTPSDDEGIDARERPRMKPTPPESIGADDIDDGTGKVLVA